MSAAAVALVVVGAAVAAFGAWRTWGPWQRARALAANEANLRRYETWRGGRAAADEGPSSAAMMRAELRSQMVRWGLLAVVGVALLFVGLVARP